MAGVQFVKVRWRQWGGGRGRYVVVYTVVGCEGEGGGCGVEKEERRERNIYSFERLFVVSLEFEKRGPRGW